MAATFFSLLVILHFPQAGVCADPEPIRIGMALTLTKPIIIPVTNAAVNPARPSAVGCGPYVAQLWLVHRR